MHFEHAQPCPTCVYKEVSAGLDLDVAYIVIRLLFTYTYLFIIFFIYTFPHLYRHL